MTYYLVIEAIAFIILFIANSIIINKLIKTRNSLDDDKAIESEYVDQIKEYAIKQKELKQNIEQLNLQKSELLDSLSTLQSQIQFIDNEFKSKTSLIQQNLDNKKQELENEYSTLKDQQEEIFASVVNDFLVQWRDTSEKLSIERAQLQQQVDQEKASYECATEAAKRAYLDDQQKNFYRLILSDTAESDIKALREVEEHLHLTDALNKAIWKVYYENPCSDLLGRVVGAKVKTGIYKITNINNQMSYVGQAVDIADRWKQHIKRGIGAEPATQNKLYPAMKKEGVEYFTFEIIEECPRSKLNEREDYWQDFYKVKEFGYSIK